MRTISLEKQTFITIFLVLVLVLMLLPFFSTFNDILTRIVINLKFFPFIRDVIVPAEVRMVALILAAVGYKTAATSGYVVIGGSESKFLVEIAWNCIGWQSLIFFVITVWTGLQGGYTALSKVKVFILGLCGTFLINIFRIALVTLVAYYTNQSTDLAVHDYG